MTVRRMMMDRSRMRMVGMTSLTSDQVNPLLLSSPPYRGMKESGGVDIYITTIDTSVPRRSGGL